jgi:hypothetical protein
VSGAPKEMMNKQSEEFRGNNTNFLLTRGIRHNIEITESFPKVQLGKVLRGELAKAS